jgi:flagella basal body P-ring formation protein FlgA
LISGIRLENEMKRIFSIPLSALLFAAILTSVGNSVAVAAEQVVLDEAGVNRIVTDYLLQKTAALGVEIHLKRVGFKGKIGLPPGKPSYEVLSPREWEGWGRGALALIVRVDGRVVENIPINLEVEALADVVVTARAMERGMVVGKEDVAIQKRDLSALPGRVCRDIGEVVGMRVRVGMRGNSPVRSDYLERPPLVRNGQSVSIVAENEMFRITTSGLARGNGAEGDTVLVRRLTTQKDIPAVVVDAETVRVEF